MRYFFIPGRFKNLSYYELSAVCETFLAKGSYSIVWQDGYFFLDTQKDVSEIFLRLGGFLKYGVLLEDDLQIKDLVPSNSSKLIFGISNYSSKYSDKDIKELLQNFKKELKAREYNVRFILPRGKEKDLSAGQIVKNKVLEKGFELAVFNEGIGQTLQVQDIEEFSKRDYEKPFVDTYMGVIPPKLARIMNNLAKVPRGGTIWDPFCGSGNILLEALDLGYNVIGTDVDWEALEGAQKNLSWLKGKTESQGGNIKKISFFDVINPTKSKRGEIKNLHIDGIVCEPYMGKPQKKLLTKQKAESLIKKHFDLVNALFKNLTFLSISNKSRVVVIFPEYKTHEGWKSIDKDSLVFPNAKLVDLGDLHWERKDSIIRRLIYVFEFNPR